MTRSHKAHTHTHTSNSEPNVGPNQTNSFLRPEWPPQRDPSLGTVAPPPTPASVRSFTVLLTAAIPNRYTSSRLQEALYHPPEQQRERVSASFLPRCCASFLPWCCLNT